MVSYTIIQFNPYQGTGILSKHGIHYPFTINEWKSDIAPQANMKVDCELRDGRITKCKAIDDLIHVNNPNSPSSSQSAKTERSQMQAPVPPLGPAARPKLADDHDAQGAEEARGQREHSVSMAAAAVESSASSTTVHRIYPLAHTSNHHNRYRISISLCFLYATMGIGIFNFTFINVDLLFLNKPLSLWEISKESEYFRFFLIFSFFSILAPLFIENRVVWIIQMMPAIIVVAASLLLTLGFFDLMSGLSKTPKEYAFLGNIFKYVLEKSTLGIGAWIVLCCSIVILIFCLNRYFSSSMAGSDGALRHEENHKKLRYIGGRKELTLSALSIVLSVLGIFFVILSVHGHNFNQRTQFMIWLTTGPLKGFNSIGITVAIVVISTALFLMAVDFYNTSQKKRVLVSIETENDYNT